MKEKKNIRKVFQIMAMVIAALVIVFVLGYSFLGLVLSDTKFRHGDLKYWLLTDQQVRSFPIIGVGKSEVLYVSEVGDGNKASTLSFRYKSNKNVKEIISEYQTICQNLKYISTQDTQPSKGYLEYIGKGKYDIIGIDVKKYLESESYLVEIYFIEKLEY